MSNSEYIGLNSRQVQSFIDDGFVKLEHAFSTDLANRCRQELWEEMGLSPDKPADWVQPVVRIAAKASTPCIEAANTARLHAAYDQLAGVGRWLAPQGLGTFPIRFPSPQIPTDLGWHVDMSFGVANPDFMEWRVNVKSSGRALLMLFLFSDVGPDDAPTQIRKGSHANIARELLPHGAAGATLRQLSAKGYASTEACEIALATGAAGTVYLCHPFIVHAAQIHRGNNRASWLSRRCCREANSIRDCRLRRFKSRFVRRADCRRRDRRVSAVAELKRHCEDRYASLQLAISRGKTRRALALPHLMAGCPNAASVGCAKAAALRATSPFGRGDDPAR